jgi:hypothetical protein
VSGRRLGRREALKLAAGAALASRLGGRSWAEEVAAEPRFFTGAERALVDELTELVIPADDHSPGARAAGVAPFIDAMLAEADPVYPEDAEARTRWKDGLRRTDALSRELHGRAFLAATPDERHAVLETLAAEAAEKDGFFSLLKDWTVDAYYTSEIGIDQELGYLGNRMLSEFVGDLPRGPARPDPEPSEG